MSNSKGTQNYIRANSTNSSRLILSDRVRDYFGFLIILAVILSLISLRGNFLLAPPYAVSAYLIVFEHGTKYSDWKSLTATYLLVIAGSDIMHVLFRSNLYGMVFNLILVSAFITFTGFSHPPAIALSIFSYIANNPVDFTVSSLLALAALLVSSYIIERYHPHNKS